MSEEEDDEDEDEDEQVTVKQLPEQKVPGNPQVASETCCEHPGIMVVVVMPQAFLSLHHSTGQISLVGQGIQVWEETDECEEEGIDEGRQSCGQLQEFSPVPHVPFPHRVQMNEPTPVTQDCRMGMTVLISVNPSQQYCL